jgi:hypothetical protein
MTPAPHCGAILNTFAKKCVSSALSHDDFRVDRLQLSPRVADFEVPVDAALLGVAVDMPGGGCRSQQVNGREAAVSDALTRH